MNLLVEGVKPSATAKQLGLSSGKVISVYKTRVKKKIWIAEELLRETKQYRKMLYKPMKYEPRGHKG
jgi:hypothetical protein